MFLYDQAFTFEKETLLGSYDGKFLSQHENHDIR